MYMFYYGFHDFTKETSVYAFTHPKHCISLLSSLENSGKKVKNTYKRQSFSNTSVNTSYRKALLEGILKVFF